MGVILVDSQNCERRTMNIQHISRSEIKQPNLKTVQCFYPFSLYYDTERSFNFHRNYLDKDFAIKDAKVLLSVGDVKRVLIVDNSK
jgi:hypothetical protein